MYPAKMGYPVYTSGPYNSVHNNYNLDAHGPNGSALAWCPHRAQAGLWVEIVTQSPRYFTSIIIQGRGDVSQWVTSFKVQYTLNGK